MNDRWIRESHAARDYYETYVEQIPVNPPGCYFRKGDVFMDRVDILNWRDQFRPRLTDELRTIDGEPPEEPDCD